MRNQGFDYPRDHSHNSDEVDAVLSNLKKLGYPLKAQPQKILKVFCDFTLFL